MVQQRYGRLNFQRALEYSYTPSQARRIARAIGADPSNSTSMSEFFNTRDGEMHLTNKGVHHLAAAQEQWRSQRIYPGPIDGIWGELSEAASKRRQPDIAPIATEVPPAEDRLGIRPVEANRADRDRLGIEPVAVADAPRAKRDWTPV